LKEKEADNKLKVIYLDEDITNYISEDERSYTDIILRIQFSGCEY
jgi:hypothetical protein